GVDVTGNRLPDNRVSRMSAMPGDNDTTKHQLGRLTNDGKVFDYDGPGGIFTNRSLVGDRQRFRDLCAGRCFSRSIGVPAHVPLGRRVGGGTIGRWLAAFRPERESWNSA